MPIIEPNDIRDNINYLTKNKEVQDHVKSLTNNEIVAYFETFIDYDGISQIRNDAVEDGVYELEKRFNS